jgi:YVTN family beta-propeller protein
VRLDPATGKALAKIHVGLQPSGVALSSGAVWVADAGGPSVSRIDPATNRVTATIRVGPKSACCAEHMSLTAVPGAIWVAVPNANQLVRVDPGTLKVVARIAVPFGPCGFLTVAATRVWSAGGGCADVVGGIDPSTGRLTSSVYEPHAVGLAFAGGFLWAAVIDSRDLDRIDPHTGRVSGRLHIAGTPVRLAVGFGSIWVNDDTGRVLRVKPG